MIGSIAQDPIPMIYYKLKTRLDNICNLFIFPENLKLGKIISQLL